MDEVSAPVAKERMDPEVDRDSLMLAEHVVRYEFAATLTAGLTVLDAASGTGYGSDLLARSGAARVVGVDYSAEAIELSTQRYGAGVEFVRADVQRLPLADHCFDCVVSFETIEHVPEPQKLLGELRRVLKPGGLLVISSPNRSVYPEGNPYHLKEYEFEEFRDFLRSEFTQVRMLGQDNWISSAIFPESHIEDSSWQGAGPARMLKASARDPAACLYAVALCSDSDLPGSLPHAALSRVSENDFWLSEMERRDAELERLHAVREQRQRAFEAELAQVQRVVEDKEARIVELDHAMQASRADVDSLTKQAERDAATLRSKEAQLASKEAELEAELREADAKRAEALQALAVIHGSTAWRLLGVYRRMLARIPVAGATYSAVRRAVQGLVTGPPPDTSGAEPAAPLEPAAGLVLPEFAEPKVSIVIPAHNHVELTRRCLESILRNTLGVPYEVIVVDDASSDGTAEYCRNVRNLRLISHSSPKGFLLATNAGAELARGRYLVLLNNDTEVRPNWLNALLEPAEADERVALVGAKLLYPDLALQEAGSIVWCDGTGWNYGRGGDPGKADYNYLREVDYCSAACLLIRRDFFAEVGGFDERYAPAYYEDTDLAFTARQRGYKVLYQSAAEVIHHEGSSSGTDLTSGVKRFQEVNRVKFVEKWGAALLTQPAPGSSLIRARERPRRNRLLVIDATVPTYDQDAGSLRMSSLVWSLMERGFAVTFLPDNRDPRQPYTAQLQGGGVEVLYGDYDLAEWLRAVAPELRMCIASRPSVAWRYLAMVREYTPECRFVFDTVDLHYVREAGRAEYEGKDWLGRLAAGYKELELGLVRAADASITVTDREKGLLLSEVPEARVHVIPTVHRVRSDTRPFGDRKDLLFVGGFNHPPNQAAVEYFVQEILPLVRQRIPDVKLHVVGSFPPPEVRDLASAEVSITGYVPDLTPFLSGCRLSVAPLTYGAGLKGKITQALSEGLPVVTTSIGAEGTSLVHDEHVLIADDPAEFADQVVRAYTDEQLWTALARNGLGYAEQNYSPTAVKGLVDELLTELKISI